MRELWERLTGESAKGYAHFVLYRDMGSERSLRKVAEGGDNTAKIRQLEKWSVKWRWVERAQAYDDEMDRQLRAKKEKAREEMAERHAKVALLGMNVAVKGLENLLTKVQTGEGTVAAGDLVRLMDTSVKIERLARNQPTDIRESIGSGGGPLRVRVEKDDDQEPDLSKLTDEQLAQLEALMKIANGEGEPESVTSREPEGTETSPGSSAHPAPDSRREGTAPSPPAPPN